ncbi:MAG: dethiobiotin synthetase, partial [Actinomycetota bacterium]|nr:dethiobiotin synthetase [Actinomycetota bacterium]
MVGPAAASLAGRPGREDVLGAAYDVGRLLAECGAVVLCGGGTGVM